MATNRYSRFLPGGVSSARVRPAQPAAAPAPIYAQGSTAGKYPTAQIPRLTPTTKRRYVPDRWVSTPFGGALGGIKNVHLPGYETTEQESPEDFYGRVLGEAQRLQNQAIATNEQRFADIQEGYRTRYSDAMGMVDRLGGSQREDINRRYGNLQTQQMQELAARGLANSSSAVQSVPLGIERGRQSAMTALEDQLLGTRLRYHSDLSGDALGFMERRSDTYPQSLDQLMQAIGGGVSQYETGGAPIFLNPAQLGYQIPGGAWGGMGGFGGGGMIYGQSAAGAARAGRQRYTPARGLRY